MIKGAPGEQLRMFMTAQELHDTHSMDVMQHPESRYGGAWPTMAAMWKVKRRENKQSGLDKHIAEHGVHTPVELTVGRDVEGEVIRHGHHRIQGAFDDDPKQLIPVEHYDLDKKEVDSSNRGPVPEWTEHHYFPSYP